MAHADDEREREPDTGFVDAAPTVEEPTPFDGAEPVIDTLRELRGVSAPPLSTTLPLLVPVMSARQRLTYNALLGLWLVALALFWAWWFQPDHVTYPIPFLLTSGVLVYMLCIPGYFLYLLGHMTRPNPNLPIPQHLRVAMATSFVPGVESLEVLERTLRAMKSQRLVEADVWTLDEGDSPDVRDLTARLGVMYFTRKGIERYQTAGWPFKARYKAGNYNAWLDAIGYERYDVLVQMDTDHAPDPDYLHQMLRPFSDQRVAYVSAPSDTSGNREQSWVVTARSVLDAPLHGPMQMGFNRRLCPIIIGSHAAMSTSALRRIDGFQRTRAEDHHNTLRLAGAGFRGVFAPDAHAVGYGPTSIGEALSQERQWARSITAVLLQFFPHDGQGLPFWQWLEFFFCETWYTLYSGSLLLGFAIPAIALLTNQGWARVSYLDFMLHFELVDFTVLAIVLWTRSQGWLRPRHTPVISWQSALLTLARWPVMLVAVVEGAFTVVLRRDTLFHVTRKGGALEHPLRWQTLIPYFILELGTLAPAVWYTRVSARPGPALGYAFLALLNGGVYTLLICLLVVLHWRDARRLRARAPLRGIGTKWAGAAAAFLLLVEAVAVVVPRSVGEALAFLPTERAQLTQQTQIAGEYDYLLPVLRPTSPFMGAYDPLDQVTAIRGVSAQEYFINWNEQPKERIIADVQSSQRLTRFPVLTIEPWQASQRRRLLLLPDIAAGAYIPQEQSVAQALKAVAPQQVDIRFGHEMDLLTSPYPWATAKPALFIAAFRQFVLYLRSQGVTNAQFIWSPAHLNSFTTRYYPGSDVVDAVGDTLLLSNGWPSQPGDLPTFASLLAVPLQTAQALHRPFIVCEAGAWAPHGASKRAWLQGIQTALQSSPGLAGVIYYDGPNAPVWGADRAVDWSLTEDQALSLFDGSPRSRQPSTRPAP